MSPSRVATTSARHGLADAGRISPRRSSSCSATSEALQGDRRFETLRNWPRWPSVFARDRSPGASPSWASSPKRWRTATRRSGSPRARSSPSASQSAYRSLGLVLLRRGDVSEAIPPLERAVELCRVPRQPAPRRRRRRPRLRVRVVRAPRRGRRPAGGGGRRPRRDRPRQPSAVPGLPRRRRICWPAVGTMR